MRRQGSHHEASMRVLDGNEEELPSPWDSDDGALFSGIRAPIMYALFITMCGAVLSTSLNSPAWFLVVMGILMLMIACMRAAVSEHRSEEGLFHDPQVLLAGNGSRGNNMLALLRSGRVVVLPHTLAQAHMQPEDMEQGRTHVHERALLAQLATQLSHLRTRVATTAASPHSPLVHPVPDEDLDSLPTGTWLPNKTRAAQAALQPEAAWDSMPTQPHSSTTRSGQHGEAGAKATSKDGRGAGSGPSHTQDDDRCFSCSICLEDFEAGDQFMTLPCMHMYHEACVRPWLKKQGRHVGCPVCKTPVFI